MRVAKTLAKTSVKAAIAAAVVLGAALALVVGGSSSGSLTFDGNFQAAGLKPWQPGHGGGIQCANYGTPSKPPRLRGTVALRTVAGVRAAVFTLASDTQPAYPKEACELLPPPKPLGLGSDHYYGYMFYVPRNFSIGTGAFWGVVTAQYHFQNIWAAPIAFELHDNHMTLALEVGRCNNHLTEHPGCAYTSNADNPTGNPGNLGKQYVVPPGSMTQGVWHEVIMHVHWASDSTGVIEVFHRELGQSSWTRTVNITGYPTVQFDGLRGCCAADQLDKVGAYRAFSATPISVALANILDGTSFDAVARHLP